ncbi:MAG: N-acetylmuramoyl-L-alanine amidase, partial [Candidatus Brocadiales bacterium]|nr:N-acetylmuramoyl-L-alanine amidase [Candidatus Brocadiales bacterium]
MFKAILDMIMGLFDDSVKEDPMPGWPVSEDKPEPEPFKVHDLRGQLTTHPTRKWGTRSLDNLEHIAVHHVGSANATFESIAKYHSMPGPQNHLSAKGAPGIAYHYGIDRDGECYHLNNDSALCWHVASRNGKALGVLVLCDASSETHEGSEEPTEEQLKALPKLLDYLKEKYPQVGPLGHCELATAT